MDILHSEAGFAVCVKPVGMDSEHGLPQALQEALGGQWYPVHRLDLNVGGLMVCARTRQAAAELSRLVQEGALVKEYVARVHGTPPERGTWEDWLFKDARRNKVFVAKGPRAGVKDAKLDFWRLEAGPESLMHIRLHTGRSHQIRVQFASRGYPLVGDHKYGARDGAASPLLWSCRLQFPWKGRRLCFTRLPPWASVQLAQIDPAKF